MNETILFIESNTTGTGMKAIDIARQLNLAPVLLTNNPQRYVGLEKLDCHVVQCDTNNLEEIISLINRNMNTLNIKGITTTSEFYIGIVSEICKHFGFICNNPTAVEIARNKIKTRKLLSEKGLLQPKFFYSNNINEIKFLLSRLGLPCVIKPVDDSGSNDVLYCDNIKEALDHCEKIMAKTYNSRGQKYSNFVLIEEYINAQEFSVEMFVKNKKIITVGITQKYLTGFPYFVEKKHIFPAKLNKDEEEIIISTVKKAIEVIGLDNGPVHTEVKLTPKGCLIIEINARLAGGMIPELILYSTGVNLIEQQILNSINQDITIDYPRLLTSGIYFFTEETHNNINSVDYYNVLSDNPLVKNIGTYNNNIRRKPKNAYDRLGYVVVADKERKDIISFFNSIELDQEVENDRIKK
ncbi:ATP-grasp domain-containing protein [Oceanobacillus kimchii]|uniref:ATP-grasp domain-containing protein n=1 Tax=Oceanobacillus kimchii TaxID=746691 RepID=UPI003B01EAC1